MIFTAERWPDIAEEIKPLLVLQWKELALDQDSIPLDPDYGRYAELDSKGVLKITTARDSGKLVGWYANVVTTHPHYQTTLFAFLDLYYLLPEYRRGAAGIALFWEMESQMRALGVREMISISKNHQDVGPLFGRMKWRATGITYTKVLD